MPDEHWEKIQSLYHQALRFSSEERKTFLANACAGDHEVQREIEALLSAAEHDSGFVEKLVGDAALQLVAVPQHPPLVIGTRLGPYEILQPIGAGGMGEVYEARNTRLDRVVAIKVSKDQCPSKMYFQHRGQNARILIAWSGFRFRVGFSSGARACRMSIGKRFRACTIRLGS